MLPGSSVTQATSADLAEPIVNLQGMGFAWPNAVRDTLQIESLTIASGERIFLQGASGSGKTTLLSLLGGVLVPQRGTISILGQDISQLKSSKRDSFRADHIGFVFQMFNLLPYLSLLDNVTLPCRFSRKRHQKATQQVTLDGEATRLLEQLQLDPKQFKNRPVTDLSVGQQQRVAVARALIGQPELIIADEPTSALDADARFAFLDLLFKEVEESRATLIFVSHDPSLRTHFHRTVKLADINKAESRGSAV